MSERLTLQEPAPTPEQVKKLGNIVMGVAADYGKLRASHRVDKAHGFVDEIELLRADVDDARLIRHRLAIRMARQLVEVPMEDPGKRYSVGARKWSMKVIDTQWFEHDNDVWVGSRNTLQFRWSNDEVTQAERSMLFVPSDDEPTLAHLKDNVDDLADGLSPEEWNDIFAVQEAYEQLNADDMEQLLDDIGSYVRLSRSTRQ
ncbi:MAG: hypothetical protein ACTJG2_00515 [Candidatus Saccharimonadales bacterium]